MRGFFMRIAEITIAQGDDGSGVKASPKFKTGIFQPIHHIGCKAGPADKKEAVCIGCKQGDSGM